MRGDAQKGFYPEHLNNYSPTILWEMVRLMLIFHCIIYLKIQTFIDYTNAFDQADILKGKKYSLKSPGMSIEM